MLALALVLALLGAETPREKAPEARDFAQEERDRQAKMIQRLVARGDAAAIDYVVEAVDRGLPPQLLGAFLDAARTRPQPAYVPRLRRHLRHRSRHLRARAMVALAAHGQDEATAATLAALDDRDLQIRLLGVDLAQRYTTPRLEEAVIALLERDEAVAKIVLGED
jgi:hypothetical protein